MAQQLLVRWGVVAWELSSREAFKVPWRDVVWALRRLEARGEVLGRPVRGRAVGRAVRAARGGRRTAGVHRRGAERGEVVVAGADPLNLTGSILGGARVPTRRNQRVVYRDGTVVDRLEAG